MEKGLQVAIVVQSAIFGDHYSTRSSQQPDTVVSSINGLGLPSQSFTHADEPQDEHYRERS